MFGNNIQGLGSLLQPIKAMWRGCASYITYYVNCIRNFKLFRCKLINKIST